MVLLPPNGITFNVLDTAQLDPGYVMDLANALDVAQVTIVQATHPENALALAQRFRRERPYTNVFYRKWKNDLHDENMVNQTKPAEWVEYFKDVLDIGCYGCIYNESLTTPISKQNNYSIDVLNLIVPKGYRSVHWKIATGNPGGYDGEYLLPSNNPRYRPDEYAQSDPLWVAIAQANKSYVDAQNMPIVWVAPHAYFTQAGAASGMTNRYKEIFRRLDFKGISRKYIPLATGEFGMVIQNPDGSLASNKGYKGVVGSSTYADLTAIVYQSEFKAARIVAHLYSLGDQQTANGAPGEWDLFNLYQNKVFWDRLISLASTGIFRLPSWYGAAYQTPVDPPPVVIPPPPPPTPTPTSYGLKVSFEYTLKTQAEVAKLKTFFSSLAALDGNATIQLTDTTSK